MTDNVPATKKEQPSLASEIWDWRPFETLRRQLDRFFEDAPLTKFASDVEPLERLIGWPGTPPVDFVETDAGFELTAELPGLEPKDVSLSLSNGALVIEGEKKTEREEKDKGYFYSERRYGSFKRSFRLPEGVDVDQIKADFDKGVLKVSLPKSPTAVKSEKKIEIASK